jgi:dTMP kinase
MPAPAGRFITLEGIDGAGKSTHVPWIAGRIEAAGRRIVATREPGGTPLGEALRALILREPMTHDSEALLMFAARREHLERVIRPALSRGDWVLCDRFTDATYAYQGGGRGLPEKDIDALVGIVHPHRQPDLTLLLDAPVETGMARAGLRNGADGPDRFETERREFFERVRTAYLARAAREPQRFRLIDATGEVAAVEAAVHAALEPLLPGRPA